MIANLSEFEVLLERYEDDPGVCSKLLRNHALAHPATFLTFAQAAILTRPVSRVLKFIAGLAISAGMTRVLLDLYARDRKAAIALAGCLQACEPRFDLSLVEYLLHPSPGVLLEENTFQAILDLLDQISEGDRLVPSVLKLLKHSSPRVRSKAALFVGSRTQNMAWAESRSDEFDARVRANIIESLFGLNSDLVQQMFRNHVADENNRVAGNAIFGLYQLGDLKAIPLICDLVRHLDARFRNTAAWLMGRTGDPRFTPLLLELMNDADELVRAQAFKGLGEVRKATRARSALPQLRASLIEVKRREGESAVITVVDANGQPVRGITPTHFIVKSGSPAKPLHDFTTEEYDSKSSLNLAFILCLPKESAETVESSFVRVLEKLAGERRTKDRWAVVKIAGMTSRSRVDAMAGALMRTRQKWAILNVNAVTPATVAPFEPKFEFANISGRVDQMIREKPLVLTEDPSEDAEMVVNNLSRVDIASVRPTWIIVGTGEHHPLLANLLGKLDQIQATVHVVATSSQWSEPGRALADATGGSFRYVRSLAEMEEKLIDVYGSLLHHYRLTWPTASNVIEIEVNSDQGRASVAEQTLATEATLLKTSAEQSALAS